MHNQDMSLVLSADAKPRLKWTQELHQRFVESVTLLGGAEKATPKTLMRVMGIPGLTLYHLKSHLQASSIYDISGLLLKADFAAADYRDSKIRGGHMSGEIIDETHTQTNESLQITQALQIQMEVQKKLHEQIEVQRHLQLRIEAQGKYLQSVLEKAQETLARYDSSEGLEAAKSELSQLVSMVDIRCPSSSLSELTEVGALNLKDVGKRPTRGRDCSMESSLTSSESSGRKDEKKPKIDSGDTHECNQTTVVLEINPNEGHPCKTDSKDQFGGRKRSGITISDGNCVDQPPAKRLLIHKENPGKQLRKFGLSDKFDLNSHYQAEVYSGRQELDLNSRGSEPFEESSKHFGA
ncbi:hypothetical protein HHK36_015353 [Tetracentron sinense]|uniref:MYB-CC type transcription factor LHEQLE-containing domain-containing protein n=1 Tax=Tetracentron sinense TaxID=13715 RepID=A0A834ZB72_TETSI|nr:hypothetical protein HHK36_015353 [Tetracentron sinense]